MIYYTLRMFRNRTISARRVGWERIISFFSEVPENETEKSSDINSSQQASLATPIESTKAEGRQESVKSNESMKWNDPINFFIALFFFFFSIGTAQYLPNATFFFGVSAFLSLMCFVEFVFGNEYWLPTTLAVCSNLISW